METSTGTTPQNAQHSTGSEIRAVALTDGSQFGRTEVALRGGRHFIYSQNFPLPPPSAERARICIGTGIIHMHNFNPIGHLDAPEGVQARPRNTCPHPIPKYCCPR